jgi:hypothetical protein
MTVPQMHSSIISKRTENKLSKKEEYERKAKERGGESAFSEFFVSFLAINLHKDISLCYSNICIHV